MGEPCKKKPRKSKLVPCTYQDLQDELKKQDTPPENIKFSVNVEVEECDDGWLTNMLNEERRRKPIRGYKSLRYKVNSKVKPSKEGPSLEVPNDEHKPGPSDLDPEKDKVVEDMGSEDNVHVKTEEAPHDIVTLEGSQDESSQEENKEITSVEEELPAFAISKTMSEQNPENIPKDTVELPKQYVAKKKRNMKKESLDMHISESDHHYPAVDKTVVFCNDTIANYYHSVIEDAIVLSPYTSNSTYKRKIANITKYICECCNFETSSQKYLEQHLELEHSWKDVFIYVKPNTLIASKNMPKDECFLADVHLGHMVYYCKDYQDAIWTLVSKWNLTVSADPRRKPGVLSYKCYYCRFQFEHYTEFEKHLNDFHKIKKIVITSEFLFPSYMNIAAGGNVLTANLNIKGPDGYQCYKCKKKISSILLLEQHTKHNINCEGCDISLPCDELQTHLGFCEKYLNSYFPKTCPCKKVFHNFRQQNTHRQFCKFGKATIAYRCIVCDYMAPSVYGLSEHQVNEHSIRSDVFAEVKVRKCDRCKHKFVDSDYHVCENRAGVDCEFCGLNFYNKKFLELHQKVYDGGFKCNQCGDEFAKACESIEHNVKNHLHDLHRIVYQCPICTAEFDTEEQNCDEAHSQEIHEMATWGGVRMKLRKVLKNNVTSVLQTNTHEEGECSQTINKNHPNLNESEVKDTEIIIRPVNGQKTKQLKVYGSKIPKELEKMIKTIKIALPKKNPMGLQVKVRSATELKALERSKFVPTVRKTENRSLLKKFSDKIDFEEDDLGEAIEHNKEANNEVSNTNKSDTNKLDSKDIFTVSSIKADFIVSNPEQDFKINEILMCISKNTKIDSPQVISDDDEGNVKFGDPSNVVIEANNETIVKSSGILEDSVVPFHKDFIEKLKVEIETVKEDIETVNGDFETVKEDFESVKKAFETVKKDVEKEKDPIKKIKESFVNIKKSTDILETVTIKQEVDIDSVDGENVQISDEIKNPNMNATFEMAKDIPKIEIDVTDNLIPPEDIKEEVIDIMTNFKNEDPGEGCSYSEVSLSNVFEISKHMLETNVEIKSEPDFNGDDMTFEDNLLEPIVEKMVVCKCGYTGTQKEYRKHRNTCQDHKKKGLSYRCLKCDLNCLDLRDYLNHLNKHGYKKYQCPSCHEIQQNNHRFVEHVLTHIKSDFRKITYIDKTDKNQTKKFRCNHCRSIFAQTDFFLHWQSHFSAQIPDVIEEIPVNSDKNAPITDSEKKKMINFIVCPKKNKEERMCFKCNHNFSRHNDMKRHYIEHLLVDAYLKKTSTKDLRCQICSQGFGKAELYKKHMRDHALLPLYQCQICDKAFSDSSNFGKHKKVHDLHTSVCDICNKKFQCELMLKKHMEAHARSEPITCELCQKTFFFPNAYNKHKKTAHGDHTFRCKICKQRFPTCKLKWEHEWEVHQERKFDANCPICNKGFRNYATTKTHMKMEHGVDSFIARALVKKFMQVVDKKT